MSNKDSKTVDCPFCGNTHKIEHHTLDGIEIIVCELANPLCPILINLDEYVSDNTEPLPEITFSIAK